MATGFKPSRPTIVTLGLSLLSLVPRAWDWIDRSNALQGWLDTHKGDMFATVVNQIVDNSWVFIIFGLILWWRDYDIKLHGREISATRGEDMLHTATYAKNDSIAPLVRLYRRSVDLQTRLSAFQIQLVEQEDAVDLDEAVESWLRDTPKNEARFNNEIRPELVPFATELKQRHGLVFSALTDDKLAEPVYGSLGLDSLIAGVAEAKERIGHNLLDELSKWDA